jgi:hypothetical protein
LLIFFGGFSAAAQVGGRILDSRGARPSIVMGCIVAAVGFALWAKQMPDQSLDSRWLWVVVAGAGMGLILGPASTDAVNRARTGYGEATGITQTARNFGSSLGLAVLGSILIAQNTSRIETTLQGRGIPAPRADSIAHALSGSGGGDAGSFAERSGSSARGLFEAVQLDFAHSLQTVFLVMAGVMAFAFLVALAAVPGGRVEETVPAPAERGGPGGLMRPHAAGRARVSSP